MNTNPAHKTNYDVFVLSMKGACDECSLRPNDPSSTRRRIHANVPLRITLKDMLEECGTLLLIEWSLP